MATGFNTQTGNGEYRLQFETDNKEHFLLMQETARLCVDGKPQTNADRIRAMSDEELAKYLLDVEQGNFTVDICDDKICNTQNCCHDCTEAAIKWLKQPAEQATNDRCATCGVKMDGGNDA